MKPISNDSKIGFIIHTYSHIEPKIYFNHMACMLNWSNKYTMAFLGFDRERTADARNILVKSAQSMNCTHIIVVDDDHIMPMHSLEALSKNEDAMIVSGIITKRKPPYDQVGFVREGEWYCPINVPIDGRSYLVDVPAMGCTLFDMEVFSIVPEPWFVDTTSVKADNTIYNKRSDTNFFEKCQKAGIKMIVDTRVVVGHLKEPEAIYPHLVPDVFEMNRKDKIRHKEDSLKRQEEVYKKASEYAKDSVLDLGCGHPAKLIKHFKDCEITGIDFPDKMLEIALESNKLNGGKNKTWLGKDLNEEFDGGKKFDVIIASDVIEHLRDPDILLKTARNHMSNESVLVVSSPEASTCSGTNPLHVKEFTKVELFGVLAANELSVIDSFSYQETLDVPYTNNVFVCKLSKEPENGNYKSSEESGKSL